MDDSQHRLAYSQTPVETNPGESLTTSNWRPSAVSSAVTAALDDGRGDLRRVLLDELRHVLTSTTSHLLTKAQVNRLIEYSSGT
jgi:hypothetical protein